MDHACRDFVDGAIAAAREYQIGAVCNLLVRDGAGCCRPRGRDCGDAMTGLGQPEDEKHTKDAGFTAHLTKPIEFSAVVNALQQAVKKQPRGN